MPVSENNDRDIDMTDMEFCMMSDFVHRRDGQGVGTLRKPWNWLTLPAIVIKDLWLAGFLRMDWTLRFHLTGRGIYAVQQWEENGRSTAAGRHQLQQWRGIKLCRRGEVA